MLFHLLTLLWALGPSDGRAAAAPTTSRSYLVTTAGTPAGDGSAERPWDLATALSGAGGAVGAGDTVWIAGGTYRGRFRTELVGAPNAPIVFRQRRGERATIDGTLRADGSHLVFWGFEIMQSDPLTADWYGLQANASYSRYINLVIHDVGTQGVSFWNPGIDSELYGCIIYNNGHHENLDHGVYVHNEQGTKLLQDNIFFNNYARGIQVYASRRNPAIRGVRVEGNVSFNNGTISQRSTRVNLLLSAPVLTEEVSARDNLLFFSGTDGINIRVGNYTEASNRSVELRGNYAGGGKIGLQMDVPWAHAVVVGNTFVAPETAVRTGGEGLGPRYRWEDNRFVRDPQAKAWMHGGQRYPLAEWQRASGLGAGDRADLPPSATAVFVRPNRYEAGRATIVVYNWSRDSAARADVSGVLARGERYEVRNVQDLYGRPVAAGVHTGEPIVLPMDGVAPPPFIGRTTPHPPIRTGPLFDVFILTRVP